MSHNSTPAIDRLLEGNPYAIDTSSKLILLREAVLEELRNHYENSEHFRRFCDARKFDPHSFDGPLHDIPGVPVAVFKWLGGALRSVPDDKVRFELQSSATSGFPSTVMIDHITAKRQAVAMARVMGEYLGTLKRPFVIFDVDPSGPSNFAIGARRAALSAYLRFASEAHFVMTASDDGTMTVDTDRLHHAVSSAAGRKAVAFGFTYVLHAAVKECLTADALDGTGGVQTVLHIGGWKKLESERVSRQQFADTMNRAFGVRPTEVIDVYGFTEQMGLNYPDCVGGWKHTPAFAEVFVRDQVTNLVIGPDQVGLLSFVTPIPHSYPGNVVVTEDIGFYQDGNCTCGRTSRRFRVIGRAQRAEIRGCGDIMANSVITVRTPSAETEQHRQPLRILAGPASQHNTDDADRVDAIIRSVRAGQEWLANQPIDALIGLIGENADQWRRDAVAHRSPELGFLASWCQPDRLRTHADFSLRGARSHVDGFRPIHSQPHKLLKAQPRGLVAHWLSGNVPILGMLTLVHSVLTKNANILKAASAHPDAIPRLLETIGNTHFTTPGRHRVDGSDLLESIAVVHYGHDRDDIATRFSVAADVRIAWGGAEAVRSVASLPRKPTSEDLIFGPKLSFMAIGSDALSTERAARRLARRAATDASVFEQTACASPHTVFVESGGPISPIQFADMLANEMNKALVRLPKDAASSEWSTQVRNARAMYEFIGTVWASDNTDWTVLYESSTQLSPPTYSRVITVRPVNDIMDTINFASPDIQTIGLALTGERRLNYADQVTRRGVERCPEIGNMTHFDTPWDGLIPMERLVRWTTLGGP